jgi:hypothetical protein
LIREVLQRVLSFDWMFSELSKQGPPPELRHAFDEFWSPPEYSQAAADLRSSLAGSGWIQSLQKLAEGGWQVGSMIFWEKAASKSEELAPREPLAACLIAMYALAAWEGYLGSELYSQPRRVPHPGWHRFPLALARNLVAADALWGADFLTQHAIGFIEGATLGPHDETLLRSAAKYDEVADKIRKRFSDCAAELAWELRDACAPLEPNFRAEVAALLWTLGDVTHAQLIVGDDPSGYIPPLELLRDWIDTSIRRLPRDSLTQYIWLELKDREPLNLRAHKVLFGAINNVFASTWAQQLDQIGPISPSRAYAHAAIEYFRGSVAETTRMEFAEAGNTLGELLAAEDPLTWVRMASLAKLILIDASTPDSKWRALASDASRIMELSSQMGVFEPYDRCLDIPFCYLDTTSKEALIDTLDHLEAYRAGNLWYWFMITPPLVKSQQSEVSELHNVERTILRELRGARFIRLLPHLPKHYQRYTVVVDEALNRPLPEGATARGVPGSILNFDPFDQDLALRTLRDSEDRLMKVYEQMKATAPDYAVSQLNPRSDLSEFVAGLPARKS